MAVIITMVDLAKHLMISARTFVRAQQSIRHVEGAGGCRFTLVRSIAPFPVCSPEMKTLLGSSIIASSFQMLEFSMKFQVLL